MDIIVYGLYLSCCRTVQLIFILFQGNLSSAAAALRNPPPILQYPDWMFHAAQMPGSRFSPPFPHPGNPMWVPLIILSISFVSTNCSRRISVIAMHRDVAELRLHEQSWGHKKRILNSSISPLKHNFETYKPAVLLEIWLSCARKSVQTQDDLPRRNMQEICLAIYKFPALDIGCETLLFWKVPNI